MYAPKSFRETRSEVLRDLVRAYPFATVVVQSQGGLVAIHLPFVWID
jgi:transcriptional regulator